MHIMTVPFNETTNRDYQGGNIETLLAACVEHGFDFNRGWAGFHQWKDAGRSIRKGEHGTRIVKWTKTKDDEGNEKLMPKGMYVFHFEQTQENPKKEEK